MREYACMRIFIDTWRALTSTAWRAGARAEVEGDLDAAAAAYAEAEVDDAWARVQRARAATVDPETAAEWLRAAEAADPTDEGARQLAETLLALAPLVDPETGAAHRLEAGALFERVGDAAAAARAYEAAGAWRDAADSYAAGGEIEDVERVIATGSAAEVAELTRTGLEARILAVAQAGHADKAMAVLAQAQARMPGSIEVAGVEAALAARLPDLYCLDLGQILLFSGGEATVGRAGLLAANVRGLDAIHARLRREGSGLIIEDTNGVRHIDARTRVDLCVGCTLELRPVPHGWCARLTVRGLDGASIWMVDRYGVADGSELVADGRWWRCAERIVLRGDSVGEGTVR